MKLNIETNHATLAGHSMQHELEVCGAAGALGSIDANTGDELIGWDTDQFPTSIYPTTQIMLTILKYGGFKTGGTNFDAKVRRESFEPVDLFHAHVGGMDAFARGLKIAAAIRETDGSANLSRTATPRGIPASARRSSRARPASKNSKPTCSRRARPTRTPAAGRSSWKISSTNSSDLPGEFLSVPAAGLISAAGTHFGDCFSQFGVVKNRVV